jgi:hypothetical protein
MCAVFEMTLPAHNPYTVLPGVVIDFRSNCLWDSDPDLTAFDELHLNAVVARCRVSTNVLHPEIFQTNETLRTAICNPAFVNTSRIAVCNSVPASTPSPTTNPNNVGRRLNHSSFSAGGGSGASMWPALAGGSFNRTKRTAGMPREAIFTFPPAPTAIATKRQGYGQPSDLLVALPPPTNRSHRHPAAEKHGRRLADAVEYKVAEWSRCTCYQQCESGVQSRSVTCPQGVTCEGALPPNARTCVCSHCAKCSNFYVIVAFSCAFAFEGFCMLVLCVNFWFASSRDEDQWSQIGIGTKLMGITCKTLPPIIRFMTFFTAAAVCVILYQAYLPGFDQDDCKSRTYQEMAVLVTILWSLMCCLGMYMARREPMPPYLHSQSQSRAIRMLCCPCRKLGP